MAIGSPVSGETRLGELTRVIRPRAVARLVGSEAAARLLSSVRSEMLLAGRQFGPRSVLVTSTRRGEGRSALALALAARAAAADSRLKVLLIDADGGGCSRMAGLDVARPGLSDLLLNDVRLDECLTPTPLDNLHVLMPGEAGDQALFHGLGVFEKLAQDGWGGYEFVVVDAGPVHEKRVLVLTRAVKTAVLAVQMAGPSVPDIEDALSELKRAGAVVLGSVLTPARPRSRRVFRGQAPPGR